MGHTADAIFGAVQKVAGTALTGTYAEVVAEDLDERPAVIFIVNSCDDTIFVSLDGGTTDHFELESGEDIVVDLGANGMRQDGSAIHAKHAGSAPTAGTLRITVIY